MDEFDQWRQDEERAQVIELRKVKTQQGDGTLWLEKVTFICSRQGTGGKSRYVKKFPDRERKQDSKRTGCSCTLIIKTYPHTGVICGRYQREHNHPVGAKNLTFTHLSNHARVTIADMLRRKIRPDDIVRYLQGDLGMQRTMRDQFVTIKDVHRIEVQIEAELVRFHPEDGVSTARWVHKLREDGTFVVFKSIADPVPEGSEIEEDAFILIIQSEFQREAYERYGPNFFGIDATHNTTQYAGMLLFTIIVRDFWGHGMCL
ncbi:hypothetical protein FA95DRAFT_1502627 [Auriscalpium vulgare]|uniref:Uncharacterized protein n=1 Tax=Auriscalpium vulgare TaxID=40419 RepID=A0ACB8R907_9AGAM|nr:hypothetical protein FA95DRAFT_1502627 [Auriscalpium vulgare]